MKRILFVIASISATLCLADPAADARASAERYLAEIKAGNSLALYKELPPSYRNDLNSLLKLFGSKMDPQIWSSAMDLVADASDVAETKASMVAELSAESSKGTNAIPRKDSETIIRTSAHALNAFAKTVTINTLRDGDIGKILANPDIQKLGDLVKLSPQARDMDKCKVTGAKASTNGVEITFMRPNGVPDIQQYVKVENIWVPNDLVKDWKGNMQKWTKSVSEFNIDAETKQKFMQTVPMLKMGLQNLKGSTDAKSFQTNAAMLMMPLMMLGAGNNEADADEAPAAAAPKAVAPKAAAPATK